MLNDISRFLKRESLTVRELAQKLGVHHSQVVRLLRGETKFRPLYSYALRALGEEIRAAQRQSSEDAPPCSKCRRPMKESSKKCHWFYGPLLKCWTCSTRCNAGMSGVPRHGVNARKLIQLERATNPNTSKEVRIPWRHKLSHYEQRYGFVWCDLSSGRPNGCGSVLSYERTAKFKTSAKTYAVFKCQNRDCNYHPKWLYCRAGKAHLEPQHTSSSLPARAQTCPRCKGRVYRRMGRAYPSMNPRRNSRAELIRCHCIKCGKTLYFNSKRGKFESDLPIGGKAAQDAHRPRCNKCERRIRRFALRAERLHKNPLLAPLAVRFKLEGIDVESNEIVAVKYWCPHLVVWKRPGGQVIYQWRRRPGKSPKARRWSGIHYKRYKARHQSPQ